MRRYIPKIEKNIPIPPKIRNVIWYDIANKMRIGDSVRLLNNARVTPLKNVIKKMGFSVVTRKENKNIRLWKVKS